MVMVSMYVEPRLCRACRRRVAHEVAAPREVTKPVILTCLECNWISLDGAGQI